MRLSLTNSNIVEICLNMKNKFMIFVQFLTLSTNMMSLWIGLNRSLLICYYE